ncbi:hypothetical protein [Endozoicomonas sp. 4G]|nr:hypothetical protein [Endozoicomonas sp. 4G]
MDLIILTTAVVSVSLLQYPEPRVPRIRANHSQALVVALLALATI